MKTVITYGTFDLYHTGHQRLLERARKLGDKLIVGVTSDLYDQSRGKLNVQQSLEERIENVKRSGLADVIIVENEEGQKIEDIQRYDVDVFAIGSDWIGKFDYIKEYCDVVYLERTKGVSSTDIRKKLLPIIRVGIVGCGRITGRFVNESKFVSGLDVIAVYGRDKKKASEFATKYEISGAYSDYGHMLSTVDAVYIAVSHHVHYEFAKKALLQGKHVLCEKPLTLTQEQATELYQLATEHGCVLMEAIKTAYAPGFCQLLGIVKGGVIGNVLAVDAAFTKIITDKTLREYDAAQAGGALTELGTYPLLAITKLLGTQPLNVSFFSIKNEEYQVDTFTRAHFTYKGANAIATVGIEAKREGDLCITGSKGYIYVPAPWWKTEYFEVRFENSERNRKYFTKFEEDGLRYEIAAFIKRINGNEPSQHHLSSEESIFIAGIIEQFRNQA